VICQSFFGADQGRYLIARNFHTAEYLMVQTAQAGVPIVCVGWTAGDKVLSDTSEASLPDSHKIYHNIHHNSFAAAVA